MRLFVAVYPTREALAHLNEAVSKVDIKLSPAERWHITLAFIGEVPQDAPARDAVTGTQPNSVGPLQIQGAGRFGSLLWVGIQGDLGGLTRLTRSLRRSLRAHRVPVDDNKFRPHLTLARRMGPEGLSAALRSLRDYAGPSWRPEEMSLVRSQLGPHPSHETVLRWEIPRS